MKAVTDYGSSFFHGGIAYGGDKIVRVPDPNVQRKQLSKTKSQ